MSIDAFSQAGNLRTYLKKKAKWGKAKHWNYTLFEELFENTHVWIWNFIAWINALLWHLVMWFKQPFWLQDYLQIVFCMRIFPRASLQVLPQMFWLNCREGTLFTLMWSFSTALWGCWKTGSKVVNFDKLFRGGFWPKNYQILDRAALNPPKPKSMQILTNIYIFSCDSIS